MHRKASPLNMSWYIVSLAISRRTAGGIQGAAQSRQYLIRAKSHDEAYNRALELGDRSETRTQDFVGILDLLLVHDQPADGAELLWSESEMADADIGGLVLRKDDMRAFREGASSSGWYVGSIILREVHDEGSHGNVSLVWSTSYLIGASSPEEAYEKVIRIGAQQQDEPGSHRCDGEKAHWEFTGIHDISPVCEAPAPGALLWCNEFTAADNLKGAIPQKSDLAVFRWEAEQLQRRS